MIYIDTSAFYAIVDSDDENHETALETWTQLIGANETLLCNNYVLVESIALIQRRVSMEAVSILHNDLIPFLEIEWLDESLHNAIVELTLASNRRQLSLVDQASFNTMRRRGISTAFTFDRHFQEQGFDVIP
jgi:predicted nucleic acid-binding protein